MVFRNKYTPEIMQKIRLSEETWERINDAAEKAVNIYAQLGVPENCFDRIEFSLIPRFPISKTRSGFHSITGETAGLHSTKVPSVNSSVLAIRENYKLGKIKLSDECIRICFVF